jgi:hypothetical protein
MRCNTAMVDFYRALANGTLIVPDAYKMNNPPSLWSYYLTLPEWCRHNPVIYNMVHAFEYHHPNVDIRQKELGMNLACSYLRPIEGRLRDVIIDVASSQKIRMNMEMGKDMMRECHF